MGESRPRSRAHATRFTGSSGCAGRDRAAQRSPASRSTAKHRRTKRASSSSNASFAREGGDVGWLRLKSLPKVGTRGTSIAVMALLGAGCGDAPESSSPSFPEKRANQELGEAILADAREVASDNGISVEEAAAAIERQPLVGRLQQALATRRSHLFRRTLHR